MTEGLDFLFVSKCPSTVKAWKVQTDMNTKTKACENQCLFSLSLTTCFTVDLKLLMISLIGLHWTLKYSLVLIIPGTGDAFAEYMISNSPWITAVESGCFSTQTEDHLKLTLHRDSEILRKLENGLDCLHRRIHWFSLERLHRTQGKLATTDWPTLIYKRRRRQQGQPWNGGWDNYRREPTSWAVGCHSLNY